MSTPKCPNCGSTHIQGRGNVFYCRRCKEEFEIRNGQVVTTKPSPWREVKEK